MSAPSALVAFPYFKPGMIPLLSGQDWVLDSGAYTALSTGKEVSLTNYIALARSLSGTPHAPRLVFALDVIGNHDRSLENAVSMRAAGLSVIPTWHAGSSLSALDEIASEFPRIAFGGLVGRKEDGHAHRISNPEKKRIVSNAFSRVWPKWIHGFGLTSEDMLSNFPFASVDSSTWTFRCSKYGEWKRFRGWIPVKLSKTVTPKTEVDWFVERQERYRAQWARQLALVGENQFAIKLACGSVSNLELLWR